MLCFRRTCPFGLPDDAEAGDDVVVVSIGHALRVATAAIAEAPLPAPLAALLAQLERHERNARRRHREALREQLVLPGQPASPSAGASAAAGVQVAL